MEQVDAHEDVAAERIRQMLEDWKREVPFLIGRDPLTSSPYKHSPLPKKIDCRP